MCIENVFMKWHCYRLNKPSAFDVRAGRPNQRSCKYKNLVSLIHTTNFVNTVYEVLKQ